MSALAERSFGVIWIRTRDHDLPHFLLIRISDPRSLRSLCIKGADKTTLVTDSPLPLIYHDLSDLGS